MIPLVLIDNDTFYFNEWVIPLIVIKKEYLISFNIRKNSSSSCLKDFVNSKLFLLMYFQQYESKQKFVSSFPIVTGGNWNKSPNMKL